MQDLSSNKFSAVHVADVVHHGERLILPEGMMIPDAIKLLNDRMEFLQQEVIIQEEFDLFPWEGAYALMKALQRKYGWANAVPIPPAEFFDSEKPPKMIRVEVAPGEQVEVAWGRFTLPNVSGFVQTGTTEVKGRVGFHLAAAVKRNDEKTIRELFNLVRSIAQAESIYRGQAIKVRFTDDAGGAIPLPKPEFIDTSSINPNQLILSREVLESVQTNLFTPIQRVRELAGNGIPVKRGVLLGGTYGTGKTLAATVASKLATDNKVTFIYVSRANELREAIEFGLRYQDPACVIFCEDIDREIEGERSVEMDDLLNIIDGLDTKSSNIITVLTTNNLDAINPAMLRPGRLDAVIDVTPPDAEAVQALIRFYGRAKIAPDTDLSKVGKTLEGCIPAVIEEVVKRAKLAELRLTDEREPLGLIGEGALLESARTMRRQLDLLNKQKEESTVTIDSLISKHVVEGLNGGGDAHRKALAREVAKAVTAATS